MFHVVKRGAQRVLGPRLTAALKRVARRPAAVPQPVPAAAEPAALAPAPATPPADPPRKLLFLSDCYADEVVWAPFHKTVLAYCGSAFERVLAVRANTFFRPWTHLPYSAAHLAEVRRAVAAFAPDLVFSINRAGLAEEVVAGTHPAVKVLTCFVDYYDRLDDAMHHYGPRDLVWGTGTARLRAEYLRKYSARLRPEQAVHTLWGVDHSLFRPTSSGRTAGIVFVGTAFNPQAFVDLVGVVSRDEHNRRVFLETYEAHRDEFVYDWPAELRRRGFAFDRLPPEALPLFENARLQATVSSQISVEKRVAFLAALAGMDVRIYGPSNPGWVREFSIASGRMLKHLQFRPVNDAGELVRLYCSARIGVNIQHDHARHHGLAFRAFDLMACRTLLVTDADSGPVLEELGFAEDRDYVCFRDAAGLREKCEFYLRHEGRRRAVAESAYEKVRARHTLAHRFAEVFSRFGYAAQAAHYEGLSRGDVRGRLDAERILKEKVTTLAAPAARASA